MTLTMNEEARDSGTPYAGRLHLLEKNEDGRQVGEIRCLGSVCLYHRGGHPGRVLGSPSSRKIFMVTGGSVAQRKGKRGLYKIDIQIQVVREKKETPNMKGREWGERDGGRGEETEGNPGIANRGNRSC